MQGVNTPQIRTSRLLLRELRESDFDDYAAMCADPEVMEYLGGTPMSASDAWRHMAMLMGHWALLGFGTWAVEESATGAFVGRIGLHYPHGWPERELGWTLARGYWGRGLAAEGCRAVLQYVFGTLGWERLISLIDPENSRSIALAERLGARPEGETEVLEHKVIVYVHPKPAAQPD